VLKSPSDLSEFLDLTFFAKFPEIIFKNYLFDLKNSDNTFILLFCLLLNFFDSFKIVTFMLSKYCAFGAYFLFVQNTDYFQWLLMQKTNLNFLLLII